MTKEAQILAENGYTIVVSNGSDVYTSRFRGIAPIIELIDTKPELLNGASAADKVIGKAAAMLLYAYGVKEIHTPLASEPAIEFLRNKSILFSYDKSVKNIINRDGTDLCPMEKAVLGTNDAEKAERLIRNKIEELRRKQSCR